MYVLLSVSVQQLCSFKYNLYVQLVYTRSLQTVVFEVTSAPQAHQVEGFSESADPALVSPPLMSSRHHILEPYGRWHETI